MMPHFTERESIVQKTLSKTQVETTATMPLKPTFAGSTNHAATGDELPSADHVSLDTGPDLLGDLEPIGTKASLDEVRLNQSPLPVTPHDDLLGGLVANVGANAAESPPSGLGDCALPTSAIGSVVSNPAPANSLYLRNEGVLHEDEVVQIGIKMEFQAHQGRLAMFIGNKSGTTSLTNVSTHFSAQPALLLQPSPLAATVGARQQQSQVVLLQCVGAYGEPPKATVQFVGPTGPTQLVLPLPLPPTKFNAPLNVDGTEFFRRWKLFETREKQLVFKLASLESVESVLTGLHFAVLKQVDPNPVNYVAAGVSGST